ncbi:MAG: hypothetical protein CVV44_03495 [Spirochaetae bacterium HGW-Spirochaetae-1]|jgi:glucosyl-3-phosphoglycerate synthase|nr:MAG: hypothetical protein CVV44_03495 [Spirochaetae bacterium HGW-Spirochaetae-1]
MKELMQYDSREYTLHRCLELKNTRKVFVIFSTLGEREADLIYDKISLLRKETGAFIDKIILSHRRTGETEERTEQRAREADPGTAILICNNLSVPDMGGERGKGADMRRTLYHVNSHAKELGASSDSVIIFLDADVVQEYFGSHFVLGLGGAVLQGHDFAKASFWRAMGRVKKFVAQPLYSVIEHETLDQLRMFAYPLSGEVAGSLEFFNSVHFWQIYGVETGINIDACFRSYSVADVNLGLYDHEHHGEVNIQKMAFGIMRTYLKQLQDYGILELHHGARISDSFSAMFIDEKGERQSMDYDLTEIKYEPLKNVLD